MGQSISTTKVDADVRQAALLELKNKLYVGEEILYTGTPNSALFLIDLAYKGLMWWGVFAFIVPLAPGDSSIGLTGMLVLIITWLTYKREWNSQVYFITKLRGILAKKTRKGDWIYTDFPLTELSAVKRSAIMKTIVMTFKTVSGNKILKFPYVSDASPALLCLESKPENGATEVIETTP